MSFAYNIHFTARLFPGGEDMKKLGSRHENLDFKVYGKLKSMIVDRRLEPGDKILQEKLARELGVSRTPLMCALKKLEQEKLVRAVPRRGFYVRLFTREEVLEAFELREVLEGLAARRAAESISPAEAETLRGFFRDADFSDGAEGIRRYADEDRRFHRYLIELGGFGLLRDILENYNIITVSGCADDMEGLVRHPRETLPEHEALIEAIASGRPEQAEKVARRHFHRSRQQLLRDLKRERRAGPRRSGTARGGAPGPAAKRAGGS